MATNRSMPGCAEILVRTSGFSMLGTESCAELAEHSVRSTFRHGQRIFAQDTMAESVFVLTEGAMRVTRKASTGDQQFLGEECAPSTIITAGVLGGTVHGIEAMVISEMAVVHTIGRDRLLDMCRQHPELPIAFLAELGRRVQCSAASMDWITQRTVTQRIARVLLDLMREAGDAQFSLPCSQSELAMSLGTVREVVFRHLRQFQVEHILHFAGPHMRVLDPVRLARAAGDFASPPLFCRRSVCTIVLYVALQPSRESRKTKPLRISRCVPC